MVDELDKQFKFHLENQDEFVEQYDGKVIVLENEKVLGSYESELDAVNETRRRHELGTFLVQRVSPGDEAYSVTFHSRVTSP